MVQWSLLKPGLEISGEAPTNAVSSPVKAIKEAVLAVISPTPNEATKDALLNQAWKRSRVQARVGKLIIGLSCESLDHLQNETETRAQKAEEILMS